MSNPYDQKNFYTQNTIAGQPISTQNNVDQSNTYYQPGQFVYPPAPPLPMRPYSHGTLYILCFCCIVAVIGVFIPGAIHNIAVSLIFGMLVSVVILDWKGFITLNGRINWKQMSKNNRWLLAIAFFFLSPLFLVFYITSSAIKSTDNIKKHQPELPSPKRRPKVGCATGIVVMLLYLPFSFAFAEVSTNTTTPQQASIITHAQSTPAEKPTTVPTTTPKLTPTPRPTPTPQPTPPPTPTPIPQPTQAPVQQSNPQPQPTQAPATQLFVSFTSASAVDHSYGSVSVHTLPGAALTIRVTYCTGHSATSSSLQGTEYADGNGDYTWAWDPDTKCPGAATAYVTASLNGQSISNSDSFNVQ